MASDVRVPIVVVDSTGANIDCTADVEDRPAGGIRLSDFRDLNGEQVTIAPGCSLILDLA